MEATSTKFPYIVVVPCSDDALPERMSHAWRVGACGDDWIWGRIGADHARFSFKSAEAGDTFRQNAIAEAATLPLG